MKRSPLPRRSQPLRRSTAPLARSGAIRRSAAIPGRSAKRGLSDAILAEARDERMRMTGGQCEGNTPACPPGRHRAEHCHHVAGRANGHDVDGLRAVCALAHQHIHGHPAWSYEHGLMVKRNG